MASTVSGVQGWRWSFAYTSIATIIFPPATTTSSMKFSGNVAHCQICGDAEAFPKLHAGKVKSLCQMCWWSTTEFLLAYCDEPNSRDTDETSSASPLERKISMPDGFPGFGVADVALTNLDIQGPSNSPQARTTVESTRPLASSFPKGTQPGNKKAAGFTSHLLALPPCWHPSIEDIKIPIHQYPGGHR